MSILTNNKIIFIGKRKDAGEDKEDIYKLFAKEFYGREDDVVRNKFGYLYKNADKQYKKILEDQGGQTDIDAVNKVTVVKKRKKKAK